MSEFSLTIIGAGSALPMHGRHPSAQVIQYDQWYCLIDCGEGTQDRLREVGVKLFKISVILISHLHGDHIFGLPGLLSSFSHLNRSAPLTIHGPKGIKGFLNEIIHYTELKISYPLEIIEHDPKSVQSIDKNADLEIFTFPLDHRIACNGYIIRELAARFHIRKEAIQEYGLTIDQLKSIRRGEDISNNGQTIPNQNLTHGYSSPVSYAYCSDTRFDNKLPARVKEVSVLYHETTFMDDLKEMALQTGHSTSVEAAKVAVAAKVSCLITGHYSSRYKDIEPLLAEALLHFPVVIKSEEGKRYDLRELARGEKSVTAGKGGGA